MRRAYIIVGKLENGIIDDYYAVCHNMERADELCLEAETKNPQLEYSWYSAIEEDD